MDAVEWLQALLDERQGKNKTYSLRAFARDCKASPGEISQILRKKRLLTKEKLAKICEALCVEPSIQEDLKKDLPERASFFGRRKLTSLVVDVYILD